MKTPQHLKQHGRKLWQELQAEYAITDSAGLALLARAAECLDRLADAQALIERDGSVVDDRYGVPKQHPAISIEKDSRNGFFAALKAMNLDIEPLRDGPGRPPGV